MISWNSIQRAIRLPTTAGKPIMPQAPRPKSPSAPSGHQPRAASAAKRAANRANAAKSTGPRSAAGKARVAQNGLRHGLGRPVWRDAALAGDVAALTRRICGLPAAPAAGERSDPRLALWLHLARPIAEAQVDVRRIRLARHRMLATALANPAYRSWRGNRARIEMLGQVGELLRLGIPLPDEMVEAFHHRHVGAEKFALVLADHCAEMLGLRALRTPRAVAAQLRDAGVHRRPGGAGRCRLRPLVDRYVVGARDRPVLEQAAGAQSPQARRAAAAGVARVRPPPPQAGGGAPAGRGSCFSFFSLPPIEIGCCRFRSLY
jgi:hypothetical protein